jgi:hypothetical protein
MKFEALKIQGKRFVKDVFGIEKKARGILNLIILLRTSQSRSETLHITCRWPQATPEKPPPLKTLKVCLITGLNHKLLASTTL